MSKYYIGIDGGGTKTAFGLFDDEGHCLKRIELSTCHYLQVGYHGCALILKQGIEEILKNREFDEICIGIGMGGYGQDESIRQHIEAEIQKVIPQYAYVITNDIHIALLGAFHEKDGILVIGGTGSIAYIQKDHVYKRLGGWGYQLGDEGSAYWVGKQLLKEFCKQSDGRHSQDMIYHCLMAYFHMENPYQLIDIIHRLDNERTQIAKLSILCDEMAQRGNQICQNILKKASYELFKLAYHLSLKDNVSLVSYSGSLFHSSFVRDTFLTYLHENNITMHEPDHDAVYGAYLYAKQKKANSQCH